MKLACVRGSPRWPKTETSDGSPPPTGRELKFGPDYLIPALRRAADPAHRAGSGAGGDASRRGHAAPIADLTPTASR